MYANLTISDDTSNHLHASKGCYLNICETTPTPMIVIGYILSLQPTVYVDSIISMAIEEPVAQLGASPY